MQEKQCFKCGETSLNKFSANRKVECKACFNWITSRRVSRCRREQKKLAVMFKGGKCEVCGYDKCITALGFHHPDKEKKEFGIGDSGSTRSWERVKKELAKCTLLCSNCHSETHEAERAKIEEQTDKEIAEYEKLKKGIKRCHTRKRSIHAYYCREH